MLAPALRRRAGVTLLDVAFAIVIVAVSVVALVQSLTTTTKMNGAARENGVALNLARNIHECAMGLSMTRLDGLDGRAYTPPISADGGAMSGYANWSQNVTVTHVLADATHDIKQDLAATTSTRLRRLVVHTRYRGQDVYSESWIVAATGF